MSAGKLQLRGAAWVTWALVAFAAGCGGGAHETPDAPGGPATDAGIDARPPTPDAGGSDGNPGDTDAGVDAPPVDPFPSDPKGGEFAWVVSAPGAGDTVSVAVDATGNIVVAANQVGAVTLDDVHVPAPTQREAVLVMKLTPTGKAVWAHSFDGHPRFDPRGIATTPSGDVVVGATFQGNSPVPNPPIGQNDGFLAVLDGATGEVRWSAELASGWDDSVSDVAAGRDAAGDTAIYVHGSLGDPAQIGGKAVPAGDYLLRFDEGGALRWALSLPAGLPFNHSMAIDPAGGPVITGTFGGDLVLGDQVLPSGGAFVAGFDPEGHVRFARQLLSRQSAFNHYVGVAGSGDVYLASGTSRTETVVDDHVIAIPDFIDHPFLVRLTAAGRHAFSTLITGSRDEAPRQVATNADGEAAMIITCHGRIDVQPEIDCNDRQGGAIVSYGPDNEYQWATYIKPAFAESIAAAPGRRWIVAGEALADDVDFGGVKVPAHSLYIAALAGGPPRLPSPLPAPPRITSAVIEGISDGEIRQGGTGTLVIRGTGLDKVASARLGDIDIHVPPGAGTATELRLAVMIPHGHATGTLALKLGNAGGAALSARFVTVSPIVLAASGSDDGLGTSSSPWRLCRTDWITAAAYGDVLRLKNGVHACDGFVTLRGGVTVRGDTLGGAIVTGLRGDNATFRGFSMLSDDIGTLALENMTIKSAADRAVLMDGGRLAVTDVDIQGAQGSGVDIEGGATATLTRYRYLQSQGSAIVLSGGRVDASSVHAEDVFRGVYMTQGTLTLTDSFLSSNQDAIRAGDLNPQTGVRDVTVVNTTLRSKANGILAGTAQLTITGGTIEPVPGNEGLDGIALWGGILTMTDTAIHGWMDSAIFTWPSFQLFGPGPAASALDTAVSLALEHVELTSCPGGISYNAGSSGGTFSLHNSHVQATGVAVTMSGIVTAADLGTAASPGNNQLESGSALPALSDGRDTAGVAIDAHGTTLNGVTYQGDVAGPADAPGYHIGGPNTIRF